VTDRSFRGGANRPVAKAADGHRYAAWFHELDAWTEYWDVYHPETRGRFYFGDGAAESGLLTRFLPRTQYPPAWMAWTRLALGTQPYAAFLDEVRKRDVSQAILEVDALVGRLFGKHFGEASDPEIQADSIEAMLRFATDSLPPAPERDARIAEDDWRKPTAGRHTLDSDLMWFAWALQLEAARAIVGHADPGHARRTLLLAGVAVGCAANFAWRGHRCTRSEYHPDGRTLALLRARGARWAVDFREAASEVQALYRIREWREDSAGTPLGASAIGVGPSSGAISAAGYR